MTIHPLSTSTYRPVPILEWITAALAAATIIAVTFFIARKENP